MRVSLSWLKEFVDVGLSIPALCERLDMTGTAVEAVHEYGSGFDGVVVGQVLSREQHPDADKLSVCSVDVGASEPVCIVCGASNYEAGDKVPVATVGATLPGGVTIRKAKLRGVVSKGMMCSAAELGVAEDAAGILVLSADAPVGQSFADYLGGPDVVLELEVTPNRPDCLSMIGVAREIAAITGVTSRCPDVALAESGVPAEDDVSVKIEEAELCPRYTARVIRDVTVGPSPKWLAERLAAAGARPINNVVDVTNYVLFEMGQPLHAFDMDTLARQDGKAAVIVRRARPGETIRTLDGVDRQLSDDALLITDSDGPIALAGVMGGETTEVSEKTTTVLLESASFSTTSISRTSRRLGLISEASLRFERGVDPELAAQASARAAALLAEVSGGVVAPGLVDVYPLPPVPRVLALRAARLSGLVGRDIPLDEAAGILGRLGCDVASTPNELRVTVPTFRPDLEREVDLIEEVLRVHGMDAVPSSLPGRSGAVGALTDAQRRRRRAGEALRAAGLNESISSDFADPRDMDRLGTSLGPDEVPVELINPMNEEQAVMRWTTLPGLLRQVAGNQRMDVADVHLYEIGTVFWTAPGRKRPKERTVVAGVLAGVWSPAGWNDDPPVLDFFDGKGALQTLLEALDVERWSVRAAGRPWLQSGRSAEILVDGDVVGWLGEISQGVLDAYGASGPVTMFEISLDAVLKLGHAESQYTEIPRYPAVRLDVALVVRESVTAAEVEAAMRDEGEELLESMRLFDVYRDEPAASGARRLPQGTKSMAYSLTYRSAERTLTDDEVRPAHERLVANVCGRLGAEVRSA